MWHVHLPVRPGVAIALRSWSEWPACHRPARMGLGHACAAGGMAGVPPPRPHCPHPRLRHRRRLASRLLTRPHGLGNVAVESPWAVARACCYCSEARSDAACRRQSVTFHIWRVRAAIAAERAAMLLAIVSQSPSLFGRCMRLLPPCVQCAACRHK